MNNKNNTKGISPLVEFALLKLLMLGVLAGSAFLHHRCSSEKSTDKTSHSVNIQNTSAYEKEK